MIQHVPCSMTSGAQQALRRTMELHSATTRFALACNQSSKIIEPIQSRCAIVRFMKLSHEEVLKQAKWVAEQEGAAYDASGLEAITFTADGDMRQALNNLQATVAGFGFVNQVRHQRGPSATYPPLLVNYLHLHLLLCIHQPGPGRQQGAMCCAAKRLQSV